MDEPEAEAAVDGAKLPEPEPEPESDDDFVNEVKRETDSISATSTTNNKSPSSGKKRLFGRQRPIHAVLGGGNTANVLLWRNKSESSSIFALGTAIWLLFECIGYHFITLVCHSLILSMSAVFLWSNLNTFGSTSHPDFPNFLIPEQPFLRAALSLRNDINFVSKSLCDSLSKPDFKKSLSATVSLWLLAVVGSWFTFATFFYLLFVMLMTLPLFHEKNEVLVELLGQKALLELKKLYQELDEKFLHKIPVLSSNKMHHS